MKNSITFSRGCGSIEDEKHGAMCRTGSCNKLNVYNWLKDLPKSITSTNLVEVRFKNTRKDYYINSNKLILSVGELIAVEASPGHDIGVVSLTGELVLEKMRMNKANFNVEFKKIYRKAKPVDIEKWEKSLELETPVMLEARSIAKQLSLNMKIGDVEFQGDGTKAVFYYIAEERVDFRELIKVLAERFRIRVEMRQIGARQEAGRIGGIGSCGRELCCSTWITNFVSVTTNSARHQELSLNPQKLAGQCGKLKCCLNYELECYVDAQHDFPDISIPLKTVYGKATHQKTDTYKRIMWYLFETSEKTSLIPLSVDRVHEIIEANKKGVLIENIDELSANTPKKLDYQNVVGQESLTRFDVKKTNKNPTKNKNKNPNRNKNNQTKNINKSRYSRKKKNIK